MICLASRLHNAGSLVDTPTAPCLMAMPMSVWLHTNPEATMGGRAFKSCLAMCVSMGAGIS
ncbi:hypothetical protein D3C77_728170 [compost metagenome]